MISARVSPRFIPDWQSQVEDLERFSLIRMIVVDLDGTFIRPTTSALFQSLRALHNSLTHPNYRVAITIATGRAWAGARDISRALGLQKGMPVILYNGAVILQHDTNCIVEKRGIPGTAVNKIATKCESAGVTMYSYWLAPQVSLGDIPVERVYATAPFSRTEFNGLQVQAWKGVPTDASECVAILIRANDASRLSGINDDLVTMPEVSCTNSSGTYVEIRPTGVNKGEALSVIARDLGIAMDQVLALGDADNDAEMLERAGIGVSVQGASMLAIQHSDYRCHYGAAEGAVELMRLVKHAKRYFAQRKRK